LAQQETARFQTKGSKPFYFEGQHPEMLLNNGDYDPVPIFFGTNSYEGSFVYGSELPS
jgi:hypothetical protein